MHIYSIGYTTTEGVGDKIRLTHERSITPVELDSMVADVFPDAAREHIARQKEKERSRTQLPPDLFEQHFIPHVRFMDVYKRVVELLIERHGFELLKYTATYQAFGLPDLMVKGDWAGDPAGNDALQGELSLALQMAGLPVVNVAKREAQEDAKQAAIAPIRMARRAERAVARMRQSGYNPLKTIDPDLAMAVMAAAAERPLSEDESAALKDCLPDLLDREPPVEELLSSLAANPVLTELALVFQPYFPFDLPQPSALSAADDATPPVGGEAETTSAEDVGPPDSAAVPQETAEPIAPPSDLASIPAMLSDGESAPAQGTVDLDALATTAAKV